MTTTAEHRPDLTGLAVFDEQRSTDVAPRQFRLIQVQLINWGTFDGCLTLPISELGVLLSGKSGSGKSTLIDGLSILLSETGKQGFNASSAEGEGKTRGGVRNYYTYVRGAYIQDATGVEKSKFFREENTWSAIAATFADGTGANVVLAQILTIASGGQKQVVRHYVINNGPLDLLLLEPLARTGITQRDLKKRLPSATVTATQRDYFSKMMNCLGIARMDTLTLLMKAKAAKNVGDLDVFIKDYMLEVPRTFELAAQAVEAFEPLKSSFEAVCRAKDQLAVLAPCVADYERYQTVAAAVDLTEQVLDAPMKRFAHDLTIAAVEEQLRQNERKQAEQDRKVIAAEQAAKEQQREVELISEQLSRVSGTLMNLQGQQERYQESLARREVTLAEINANCTVVGIAPVDSESSLDAARKAAATRLPATEQSAKAASDQRDAHIESRGRINDAANQIQQRISYLQQHATMLDRNDVERRRRISDGTGIPVSDLPFVAELIEVKAEERIWTVAAERILRRFAMTILVDAKDLARVSRYVNSHSMSVDPRNRRDGRVLYRPAVRNAATGRSRAATGTLAAKLEVSEGPWKTWLWNRLVNDFDYLCVEHTDDASWADPAILKAVTQRGLTKNRDVYEKDDSSAYTSPEGWILGSNTAAKITSLIEEATAINDQLSAVGEAVREAADEMKRMDAAKTALRVLCRDLDFSDLDTHSMKRLLRDVSQRIEAERSGNPDLAQLSSDKEQASRRFQVASNAAADCRHAFKLLCDQEAELVEQLHRLQRSPASALTISDEQHRLLQARFAKHAVATATQVDSSKDKITNELLLEKQAQTSERVALREQLLKYMHHFVKKWDVETEHPIRTASDSEFELTVEDYLAIHDEIETKGLPKYQQEFADLLTNNTTKDMHLLLSAIDDEERRIRSGIHDINIGLTLTEYSEGAHLQINFDKRSSEQYLEFKKVVQDLFHKTVGLTLEQKVDEAVRRFPAMKRLMTRFESPLPEHRHWREAVLDVRRFFQFHAAEIRNDNGHTKQTWDSSNVNSGGEQERLVAFCFAAALSYQMGTDEGGYTRFGLVILDEAFNKSDDEFTGKGIDAYKAFGFQVLAAAPMNKTNSLAPHLGGVGLIQKNPDTHRSTGLMLTLGEYQAAAGSLDDEDA